jgi:alkylation response protein AidB-like acyl-CoA dehydrogenase
MLADTIESICEQFYGLERIRQKRSADDSCPQEFWQALVNAGFSGLVIDEEFGGAGLGLLDAVSVFQALGRHLASSPLLVSSLLAARAIDILASPTQRRQWLPAIASGDCVVSVAQLEAGCGYDSSSFITTLKKGKLNGEKILVPHASLATHLLVLATDEDNEMPVCCLVDTRQSSLQVSPQDNIACAEVSRVTMVDVAVESECIVYNDQFWSFWQSAMSYSAVAAAAECNGGAQAMLSMTVEYANNRIQFGKPIGAFQSLSHYMAELATELEGSKTLNHQAAWAFDQGRDWHLLAAQSKLQAGDGFRRTTAVGTQIHGGLGFTREANPQLFFRHAKLQQLLMWDPCFLEQHIASLMLDTRTETQ